MTTTGVPPPPLVGQSAAPPSQGGPQVGASQPLAAMPPSQSSPSSSQPSRPVQQPQQPQQPQQSQPQHLLPLRAMQQSQNQPPPAQPPQRAHHAPGPLAPLQPLTPNAMRQPTSPVSPPPVAAAAASPPNKRDLKSWWKSFKLQSRSQEPTREQQPRGIFGVPLRQSIPYANVAISLVDENGRNYTYGYVPIVVAKCGVFLKERATEVEGIFRLSGSEKRIKELKLAFDSPDRYGKGLLWTGYTVHDAANVLRRYLNDLPEPVVPLALYERFREPLRHAVKQGSGDADGPQFVEGFDASNAIDQYQGLITELPPLNRQLLLYILDLLAVFASKSDVNRMNSQNLAAIFQPGILSHPSHAMAPEEYRLNQTVLIFLIENQDHFLIGMRGTAADATTVEEVQRGTPPVTPGVAKVGGDSGSGSGSGAGVGVTRTASNASAGAESVARDGKIRRNRSTSSRNSKHSRNSVGNNNVVASNSNHVGHAASPRSSSPAVATTPTTANSSTGINASGGLARSNTLPARSPGLGPGRFPKRTADPSASPVSPLTPINAHASSQATPTVDPVAEVVTPADDAAAADPFTTVASASQAGGSGPVASAAAPKAPPSPAAAAAESGVGTPSKERRFQLFQRSFTNDSPGEPRPTHNKLRKKRLPSSTNPSAQSSTASLAPSPAFVSPSQEPATNPLEEHAKQMFASPPAAAPATVNEEAGPAAVSEEANDSTPRVSQVPSAVSTATATPTPAAVAAPSAAAAATASAATTTATTATPATPVTPATSTTQTNNTKLRPQRNSPSTSLHSSFNEGSDMDQIDESAAAQTVRETHNEPAEKTKRRLWRLSKRREDLQPPANVPAPVAAAVAAPTPAPAPAPAPAAPATVGPQPSTSNLSAVSTPPGPGSSLGSNAHAGISTSSVGSGGPSLAGVGTLSLTGASGSSDSAIAQADAAQASEAAGGSSSSSKGESKDEQSHGKLTGWLKSKYREAKETAEQRRNKSPSPTGQSASASTLSGIARGKSLDLDRVAEEGERSS